jgi:PAS domain S-box-containing protein
MGVELPEQLEEEWQQGLERLEERLRCLIDLAQDGHLVTDRQGIILEANQAAADLFQTRREFLIGKPFPFLVDQAEHARIYEFLSGLPLENDRLHDLPVMLRRRRRRDPVFVALTTAVVRSRSAPVEIHWLLRDLTLAASLNEAFRLEKSLANGVMEVAQTAVLLLDAQGRILRCNPYIVTVTGHPEPTLVKREWVRLLSPADQGSAREALIHATVFQESRRFLGGLPTLGGAPRCVVWSVKLLSSPEGKAPALLVLGHDVTDLKRAQEQAVQSERLAAIGQMTAVLLHESRSLLQSGQACLERLSWRLHEQPDALDLIRRAQQAQVGLNRLFEDVRAYASPLHLEAAPCRLSEVWQEAWKQVRSTFADREAFLAEDIGTEHLNCQADRFRLVQVFRNIFENSFQACPGLVRVELSCREERKQGRLFLAIVVRDHGPGLTDEQRLSVFEPFYTTRPRGCGLGMAIAKRIVEAHGGEISVEANGDPGARIRLLFPTNKMAIPPHYPDDE